MKVCSKCKIEKYLSEFHKDNNRKDGYYCYCKKCVSKYHKKHYIKNYEKILEQSYGHYKKNREKVLERHQKHRESKASYNTYALQISWAKDPIRNVNGFLQTKCTYCGKWYFPIMQEVQSRIRALNGQANSDGTENRLYCSKECKQTCPIFHKQKYQVGHPKQNENIQVREVQPELRQMVFERDNYTCLKCKRQNVALHCHHTEGILWNPLESADIDQCMTVCKDCHKEIHKQNDCGYHDLQCKKAA